MTRRLCSLVLLLCFLVLLLPGSFSATAAGAGDISVTVGFLNRDDSYVDKTSISLGNLSPLSCYYSDVYAGGLGDGQGGGVTAYAVVGYPIVNILGEAGVDSSQAISLQFNGAASQTVGLSVLNEARCFYPNLAWYVDPETGNSGLTSADDSGDLYQGAVGVPAMLVTSLYGAGTSGNELMAQAPLDNNLLTPLSGAGIFYGQPDPSRPSGSNPYAGCTQLVVQFPETAMISLSESIADMAPGETRQLMASVQAPDDALTAYVQSHLAWTSSDPSIATVSPDGVVTMLQPGEVTISASFGSAVSSATVYHAPEPDPTPEITETPAITDAPSGPLGTMDTVISPSGSVPIPNGVSPLITPGTPSDAGPSSSPELSPSPSPETSPELSPSPSPETSPSPSPEITPSPTPTMLIPVQTSRPYTNTYVTPIPRQTQIPSSGAPTGNPPTAQDILNGLGFSTKVDTAPTPSPTPEATWETGQGDSSIPELAPSELDPWSVWNEIDARNAESTSESDPDNNPDNNINNINTEDIVWLEAGTTYRIEAKQRAASAEAMPSTTYSDSSNAYRSDFRYVQVVCGISLIFFLIGFIYGFHRFRKSL